MLNITPAATERNRKRREKKEIEHSIATNELKLNHMSESPAGKNILFCGQRSFDKLGVLIILMATVFHKN